MDEAKFKVAYDTRLLELEEAARGERRARLRSVWVSMGVSAGLFTVMAWLLGGVQASWRVWLACLAGQWSGMFLAAARHDLGTARRERRKQDIVLAHLRQARGWIVASLAWPGHVAHGSTVDEEGRAVQVDCQCGDRFVAQLASEAFADHRRHAQARMQP